MEQKTEKRKYKKKKVVREEKKEIKKKKKIIRKSKDKRRKELKKQIRETGGWKRFKRKRGQFHGRNAIKFEEGEEEKIQKRKDKRKFKKFLKKFKPLLKNIPFRVVIYLLQFLEIEIFGYYGVRSTLFQYYGYFVNDRTHPRKIFHVFTNISICNCATGTGRKVEFKPKNIAISLIEGVDHCKFNLFSECKYLQQENTNKKLRSLEKFNFDEFEQIAYVLNNYKMIEVLNIMLSFDVKKDFVELLKNKDYLKKLRVEFSKDIISDVEWQGMKNLKFFECIIYDNLNEKKFFKGNFLKDHENLKNLWLKHVTISVDQVTEINSCKSLKEIVIFDSTIEGDNYVKLFRSSRLEHVDFYHSNIEKNFFYHEKYYFHENSKLREFWISDFKIPRHFLEQLCSVKSIRNVNFEKCIFNNNVNLLFQVSSMKVLNLEECKIDKSLADDFEIDPKKVQNLEFLEISRSAFIKKFMEEMILKIPNIKEFNFSIESLIQVQSMVEIVELLELSTWEKGTKIFLSCSMEVNEYIDHDKVPP